MTQDGVIGVDSVAVVAEDEISECDAQAAGYQSREELLSHLAYREDPIYRIAVHFAGEDPRIALRENADLSENELRDIVVKLDRLDKNSKRGAWTRVYLQLIQDMPGTYSGLLADHLGIEIAQFKPWVRKLKALALTESLEVGYQLSPRGEKVLTAIRKR